MLTKGTVDVGGTVDAAVILAKNVGKVQYEHIPSDVLDVTKKDILDTLAVTLGGSTVQGAREVVDLFKHWGGREESSILAYGGKVPAPGAAQVNSIMSYMADYSDTYDVTGMHPGTVVIPVCLAMAEREGKVSGKELLTAVALGIDLGCRMSLTPRDTRICWNSQIFNYFASAACAGKIMGLDEEKMISALGIAYAQAAGTLQTSFESCSLTLMQPSFAASGGIVSAMMAEKGITGARNSLEGPRGLYHTCFQGDYSREPLIADLGDRFEGLNISLKPYPCCRWTHQFVQATLALREEYGLRAEDVAEITARVGKNTRQLVCEPVDVKYNPQKTTDAQLNLPWTVATALVRGGIAIKDFAGDAIRDSSVLQVARKVTCKLDESLTGYGQEPGIVEIKIKDGRVVSRRVDPASLYGSPKNPLSWGFIVDKLKDCASYAPGPIPRENLEMVVDMVTRLEEVDDVSSIVRLLS